MNILKTIGKTAGTTAMVLFLASLLTYCGGGGGGGTYGTTTTNPTPTTTAVKFSGFVTIKTALDAAQEVPAGTSTGTGTAVFTVKPGTGELSGSVTFSGLSSNATLAHIHQGAAGTNGGVQIDLAGGAGGTSGTWTVPAGTILNSDQLASLFADGLYINIHTVNNGAGEIRGQITFPTASITTTLSGAEEVPAVATTATGTGSLTVNFGTGALSGSVSFTGLSSNATLAHIHTGAAGANGGVLIALSGGAGATSGTWTVPAGAVLSGADMNALINDGLYLNIHSANNGAGEIRGQIKYRISFTTQLNGSQEVPPLVTSGTGTANLSLNPATGALSGTVDFTGLSSAATLGHIHQAAAGANGGVVITLDGGAGGTSGTWTVPANTVLGADLLNALMADDLYINIHSTINGTGEIRGQITSP